MKKKYKIDFIEEPEIFSDEEMMALIGGGLCIGFSTCNCFSDKKDAYTVCGKVPKDSCSNYQKKFFIKKYDKTLCIIVKIGGRKV